MTDLKGTGAHPQDTAAAAAFLDSRGDVELIDVDRLARPGRLDDVRPARTGSTTLMPEEMNIEAAYALSERGGHASEKQRRRRELGEILEIVILATVAVATAWSGYQAARWDGRQALLYGESTTMRIEADEAATLGGQQRLLDVSTFNTWIEARAQGQDQIADLYVERFSPEFRVAFDAWLQTMPFSDSDAPPGPSFMPEYHNEQIEHAAELNRQANEAFERGTEAREPRIATFG